MQRLSRLLPAVDRLYALDRYVPASAKATALAGMNAFVAAEESLGANTVPVEYEGRRIEFVYPDAASMLYFKLSIDLERISHEVPYAMLDLPSQYDLAIDVGAHFGTYSVLLGSLNDLELLSVEPNARNRRILEENLRHNGIEATVDGRLVSGSTGETTFYEASKLASNAHTMRPPSGVEEGYVATTAETVTISTLIDDSDADAVFVKIDAEGEETAIVPDLLECDLEVLSGLIELHPDQLEGDPMDVLGLLLDRGLSVEPVPYDGNPVYRFRNEGARELESTHGR